MSKETGDFAFPSGSGLVPYNPGMELRDYFAANADIGDVDELTPPSGERLLGRACPSMQTDLIGCFRWWAEYRAVLRYIEADAMLEARKV